MYQIFVVEDELLIRQSIRNMVENLPGPYAFCGEASDGEMALSMMQDLMPDILLTDIRMPFLDGFELIRHVKAMMPWLKIIIISGFGEFESAQKAISLGVDLYLLKPIRSAELTQAIEKVAGEIEKSRSQNQLLPAGYDKDEVHNALTQHFMQQLLYSGADTGVLLERARALDLDIVSPWYQGALFNLECEKQQQQTVFSTVRNLLSSLEKPLYHLSESGRLTLLLCANDRSALTEEMYRIINIIRHELNHLGVVVTTVVGSVVERVSAIRDACNAAGDILKKVQTVSAGQVIDINDTAQITAEIATFSSPFDDQFRLRLQQTSLDDLPALLDDCLDHSQFSSMLMRYDALIDILKITVQIISKATPGADSKDIAAKLSSQHDLFAASARKDSFRQLALELLQEAVSQRQESSHNFRHSHVINRAMEYVAQHFCDPNISLIAVAKHVGMSSAHFSMIFSQTVGKSFISHLTGLRIERAKVLLSTTDMLLSNIAMEIGYNEPNYFSHVFRKNVGMTPKEYRAQYGQTV